MLIAGLVAFALAAAAEEPQAEPPATVEELVVQGAAAEAARRFVEGVAPAETRNDRLARWDRPVCVTVMGLRGEHGRYVAERINDTVHAVGLKAQLAPCRPDVVVMVTPEPDEAAARLVAEQSRAMALNPRSGQLTSSDDDAAVQAFVASDRPVRWWWAVETRPADGATQQFGSAALPELGKAPVTASTSSSRLKSNHRDALITSLIVVDGRQLRGVSYEQLASYVSIVALAQIAPEPAPAELSSILTLFEDVAAGREAQETLTAYDLAYLQGLYTAPSNAYDENAQKSAIAARMEKAAAKAP